MLLHNHIKEENEKDDAPENYDAFDSTPRPDSAGIGGERPFPFVVNNNEQDPGGRPSVLQEESNRVRGEEVRRSIAVMLQMQDMHRPLYSGHGECNTTSMDMLTSTGECFACCKVLGCGFAVPPAEG